MSRKQTLPYDVRLECIAYVRGYPRRVQAYNDARREILSGGSSATEGMPRSPGIGRPSESKAEQLAAKLMKEPEVEEEPESKEITVDYSAEVGEQLSRCLGRKVKLIDGKKTGRIELEFYGADDREALIEKLKNLK